MAAVKLLSPWELYYRKMDALFSQDPEVGVVFDAESMIIKLYVNNARKAFALEQLLPKQHAFGKVTLNIGIIPTNNVVGVSKENLFKAAFQNNPILNDVITAQGIFTNALTYVIFEAEVVQYWTDNLGDYNGICSTLYQDIARDIFEEQKGVYFCTEKKIDLGRQWP